MAHTEAWIFFIHAEYLQTLQALGTAVHCFYVNINKETGRRETESRAAMPKSLPTQASCKF